MNSGFLHRINPSKPVIVNFYADWCVPCNQIPLALKEVKQELKGIHILKVNVEENPFIAGQYNVRRLPALMVFLSGKPEWKGEGIHSASELKTILSRQMDKN